MDPFIPRAPLRAHLLFYRTRPNEYPTVHAVSTASGSYALYPFLSVEAAQAHVRRMVERRLADREAPDKIAVDWMAVPIITGAGRDAPALLDRWREARVSETRRTSIDLAPRIPGDLSDQAVP